METEIKVDVTNFTYDDAINLSNEVALTIHGTGIPYPLEMVVDALLMQIAFVGMQVSADIPKDDFISRITERLEHIYDHTDVTELTQVQ
jgi:hypothetical protein